ncbi:MAG: efflux RND transporter periplasmic adaptor subunit [Phycisphaerae bacterium]|nr:efflux RND transporter periplasmic adaptor subunit [Phycisphaerae bacterium]
MLRIVVPFVIVVGSIITFLVWKQAQVPPFVVSGFVEADEIRVGSRVGGRVSRISIEEGATTKIGDELYALDPYDLTASLAQARAEAAAAQADFQRLKAGYRAEEIDQARARRDWAQATLSMLVAGPRPQEIAMAREQVKIATASRDLAQLEFDRLERLREREQAAAKEYDAAVAARKEAIAELARAELALALLEEGSRKEDIAAAQARLVEAEAALKLLESGYRAEDVAAAEAQSRAAGARVSAMEVQLAELTVHSPCNCLVETIDLRPGDLVSANAPTAALLDLSRMWVRSYVPEGRLGSVRIGQVVSLRPIGMRDRRFAGRISFIAREAEFTPRNIQTPEERSKQVFRIKIALEGDFAELRVGMSVDVLFDEVPRL